MKSCVIDIGSNTIRAVVYDIAGENITTVFNKGIKSMLFDYTADGALVKEGIAALSDAMAELCRLAADYRCDCHAFATSAFRDLKNQQEIISCIETNSGIRVRVLSGEEESECDYIGLRRAAGAVCGTGIDLGGGSCQILSFSEDGLTAAKSLPLGTLRLKRQFVSDSLPDGEEGRLIYDYVTQQIAGLGFLKRDGQAMLAMGGSARAVREIKRVIKADNSADCISTQELSEFVEFAKTPGSQALFKSIVKSRYDTVVVGMIIMRAIAEFTGADSIGMLDCGVRDGYVIKYIM